MLAFVEHIFKEFLFENLSGCDFEKKAEKSVVLSGFLPLGNFSQFRRLPSKVARFVFSPHHHCLNRSKECCIQWLFSFQNSKCYPIRKLVLAFIMLLHCIYDFFPNCSFSDKSVASACVLTNAHVTKLRDKHPCEQSYQS